MAIATFALIETVSPVDVAPATIAVTITDPAGLVLPVISVPSGATATSVTTPPLLVVGTYTYSITNLDASGAPVSNAKVAYPPVTGFFANTLVGLSASIVTAATVTVA